MKHVPLSILLLVSGSGCSDVRFARVERPTLPALRAAAPTPPESKVRPAPAPDSRWQAIDGTAKAALHRKLIGVEVAVEGGLGERAGFGRGALTTALMARLFKKGFGSLLDLSSADKVTAEVQRRDVQTTTTLRSTLGELLAVAAPLRADYALRVRFVGIEVSAAREIHYALAEQDLASYQTSFDAYQRELAALAKQLGELVGAYQTAFAAAKRDYDAKNGSYSWFPESPGYVAMNEQKAFLDGAAKLREALQAAQQSAADPAILRQQAEAKVDRQAVSDTRLDGIATLVETSTNRVVWIGLATTTTAEPGTGVAALIDKLADSLP